jgi:hypothetical protein
MEVLMGKSPIQWFYNLGFYGDIMLGGSPQGSYVLNKWDNPRNVDFLIRLYIVVIGFV